MKHILNMNKRTRIIKVMAVALAFCLTMGIAQKTVMASTGYTSFPYIFNGGSGIPSSASHITQTVEVQGTASENAYALCTEYSYTGNMPVLTVQSISTAYPTDSVSFTGASSDPKPMEYTSAIPPKSKTVTFQGKVTNYSTYFTIVASVKG